MADIALAPRGVELNLKTEGSYVNPYSTVRKYTPTSLYTSSAAETSAKIDPYKVTLPTAPAKKLQEIQNTVGGKAKVSQFEPSTLGEIQSALISIERTVDENRKFHEQMMRPLSNSVEFSKTDVYQWMILFAVFFFVIIATVVMFYQIKLLRVEHARDLEMHLQMYRHQPLFRQQQ